MARSLKKDQPVEIDVIDIQQGVSEFFLVGTTPFYCNRMAAKAKRELLLPRGPLTKTQRATKLKHAPFAEYRDSPYMRRGDPGETLLMMAGSAPKMSIAGAALRMPTSVNKTEIKQLVSVPVEFVPLWGIPRLDMSVVRMAGISRTPDIRTRARIDHWAMQVPIHYIRPMLNEKNVAQLAIAAGIMCGLGDWRIEKGGPHGSFRLATRDDPELLHIMETGGYLAQKEALDTPETANGETEELLDWYLEELESRGINPENEVPEDIETEPDAPFVFGAGDEHLVAPADDVSRLQVQNGAEVS